MMKRKRASIFAFITLSIFLLNFVLPISVLADDETPPPAPTEEVILEEESTDSTTQTDDETAPPTTPEEISVSEILEQLPENTEIVVLDENGEALPLVTEVAAQIILQGDPMWCPENQLPGDSGCTLAFTDFESGTGLFQYLITNNTTYTGNGTIYIAYDYNPTTAGDGNVQLSGTVLQGGGSNGNLANIVIQGGWDFGSNTVNDQTNFGANNFSVFDWNGNVTINNINIDGATGNGMNVFGNGDVTLNNVTVNNSDFFGVNITNTVGSGDVTVNNSTINNSTDDGLYINTNGEVNLSNVTANENGNNGVSVDNTGGNGTDVIITGINNFNNNDGSGIFVFSEGDINAANITANNNLGFSGATLNNLNGASANVNLTGTNVFNGNVDFGLGVFSSGNITLNNVTANENSGSGAYLESCGCDPKDITLTGTNIFNNNGIYGLEAYAGGDIKLSNVTANENDFIGASLESDGDVTITNFIANNNGVNGLEAFSGGNITINNITANENLIGILLTNDGNVIITNGQFTHNIFGVTAVSYGNITVNNITADENLLGMTLVSDGGDVTLTNAYVTNSTMGINGSSTGNITLENVIADGNVWGAFLVAEGSNITVKCSMFSNNSVAGIQTNSLANTPELNLFGVTFSNNALDYENLAGAVNVFDYNCNPSTKKPTSGTGLPLNIVQGGAADLDCDKFSGTVLILPNGDKVTFKCPIDGSATLNAVLTEGLPNALPEGMEYVSGMVAVPSPDGSDVALDGLVVVSFIIPEGMQGEDFAILYWDGTEWVDLGIAKFDDGRAVINGGYVTKDGYFEALTNFSGNFVLVKK